MIQTLSTFFIGAISSISNSVNSMIIIYLLSMLAELTTKLIIFFKQKKLTREVAVKHLWKKLGAVLIILVAALIDNLIKSLVDTSTALPIIQDINMLFCPWAITWFVLEELKSITKNAVMMGASLPKFISNILKQLNQSLTATNHSKENNNIKSDTNKKSNRK